MIQGHRHQERRCVFITPMASPHTFLSTFLQRCIYRPLCCQATRSLTAHRARHPAHGSPTMPALDSASRSQMEAGQLFAPFHRCSHLSGHRCLSVPLGSSCVPWGPLCSLPRFSTVLPK